MIFLLLFLFVFRETLCNDVVSAEKTNTMQDEKVDPNVANINVDPSFRRFIDDMDDKEWHLSHLKNSLDVQRTECEKEEFINKYKKGLKNDGALVNYVSAYALQPLESEPIPTNKCPAPNKTSIFKVSDRSSKIKDLNSNTTVPQNISSEDKAHAVPVNIATTTEDPRHLKTPPMVKRAKKSRRGDYQFSSVEYYDDVLDFDEATCPDSVQVIELEINQLRNYDVLCESMIEWRSLDNA